jgi:C_GCAxxG_C_C family probable redox protein
MDRAEQALARFREGFNCAQALVSTYSEDFGVDRLAALRIAGPFGGGIAHKGETCGAVTGALMVLGLRYGNEAAGDERSRDEAYSQAGEFLRRFESRNRTVICRELLDCDIGTPEGMKLARETKLFYKVCPKYVRDAVEIIEEMLR